MAYLFDDDKSKIDFEAVITPKLNALQTAFQNSVNSIYNKFVSQGTTPTAKTPQAIATAVDTLATNKYNSGNSAGRTAAESVTWHGYPELEGFLRPNWHGLAGMWIDLTNVVNLKMILFDVGNPNHEEVSATYEDSNGNIMGGQTVDMVLNTTYTPPSGAKRVRLTYSFSNSSVDNQRYYIKFDVQYKAKILR